MDIVGRYVLKLPRAHPFVLSLLRAFKVVYKLSVILVLIMCYLHELPSHGTFVFTNIHFSKVTYVCFGFLRDIFVCRSLFFFLYLQ